MSASAAITCDAVSVIHRRVARIDHVDFSVKPGECVAIVGANGSGKTTLLHTIMGILRPTEGKVLVDGGSADDMRRTSRLGYVPQHSRAASNLPIRVRDVVAMGRCGATGPGRRLTSRDRAIVDRAMQDVHVTHLADRSVDAISGGERQRMQLARVLAQQASIMLLDEPAANLDLGGRCEIFDLVAALHAEHGMTVLLVMHELAYLPDVFKRALVLDAGRVAWDGEVEHVFGPEMLQRIYGDNAERVRHDLRGLLQG